MCIHIGQGVTYRTIGNLSIEKRQADQMEQGFNRPKRAEHTPGRHHASKYIFEISDYGLGLFRY